MKALIWSFLVISGAMLRAEQPVWEPEKTWVFAVGVLKFDNPATPTYPDEGRVDAEMIAAMEKRGVPADHVLFIKNEEATKENVVRQLDAFLKRPGAEDTLFFYYAGHGGRDYNDPARTCTFLTYDTKSSWTVSSVFESVDRNFHGRQVIYAADCCHSGSLVVEAAKHREREAELSSAHVSSTSTGAWTFTQCLMAMFQGDPVMDLNGDGKITFAEAAHYIVDDMAFAAGQHADDAVNGGFSMDTVMAEATGPHTPRMGEMIEGYWDGKWWKAEVLKEKEGQVFVTWLGWSKKYDSWLPLASTRVYHPKTDAVGEAVQVNWQGQWYDARIVKVEDGLQLVHYEGYPEGDDEWVTLERLRAKAGK